MSILSVCGKHQECQKTVYHSFPRIWDPWANFSSSWTSQATSATVQMMNCPEWSWLAETLATRCAPSVKAELDLVAVCLYVVHHFVSYHENGVARALAPWVPFSHSCCLLPQSWPVHLKDHTYFLSELLSHWFLVSVNSTTPQLLPFWGLWGRKTEIIGKSGGFKINKIAFLMSHRSYFIPGRWCFALEAKGRQQGASPSPTSAVPGDRGSGLWWSCVLSNFLI